MDSKAKLLQLIIQMKEDVSAGMDKLATNVDKNTSSVNDKTSKMSQNFGAAMKASGAALIGVGAGLVAYEKQATSATVSMVNNAKGLSRLTGESVEDSSRLLYATQRVGVSYEDATTKVTMFTRHIADARDASSDAALKQEELKNKVQGTQIEIKKLTEDIKVHGDKTGESANKVASLNLQLKDYQSQLTAATNPLEKLNVATQNADGSNRSFNEILLDVSDRFHNMPDGIEKTNAAVDLFGRGGQDMIKLLNQGSKGIKEMEDQADKLGLTLNAKTIGAVSEYIKSTKDLKEAQDALKITTGTLAAPAQAKLNTALADGVKFLNNLDEPFKTVTADVLAFGGPIATGAGSLFAFIGNLASASPLLDKFGGGLLGGVSKFGLWGLAAGGAFTLGMALHAMFDANTKSVDDNAQANATAGGKADLLALAQGRVDRATQGAKKATDDLKIAQDALAPVSKNLSDKQKDVADHQDAVKRAFDDFGSNSPQYQQAVADLKVDQDNLSDAMNKSATASLSVMDAQGQLKLADDELKSANDQLKSSQDALTDGLNGTVKKIAEFGPVSSAQISPINDLAGAVQGVIDKSGTMGSELQKALTNSETRLQGIGSTIEKLQGQGQNLDNQLQKAKANAQGTQGVPAAQGVYQARAGGGPVQAGTPYIVGEEGRELFIPSQPGRIVSAPDTAAGMGKSVQVVMHNTFVNPSLTEQQLQQAASRLAWGLN